MGQQTPRNVSLFFSFSPPLFLLCKLDFFFLRENHQEVFVLGDEAVTDVVVSGRAAAVLLDGRGRRRRRRFLLPKELGRLKKLARRFCCQRGKKNDFGSS